MNFVIRKKSVNVCTANVLLIKVEHCDVGVILENHTGNNLVTN